MKLNISFIAPARSHTSLLHRSSSRMTVMDRACSSVNGASMVAPAASPVTSSLPCRAAAAFPTPAFQTMRERCIVQELSWEKPARKWEAVLEELWHSQAAPTATQQAATATKQAAAEQRRASHPTPVQAVNKEGDAVPRDAVARKAAATQVPGGAP